MFISIESNKILLILIFFLSNGKGEIFTIKSSAFINIPSLRVDFSDILKFFKSIPISLNESLSKVTSLLRLFFA